MTNEQRAARGVDEILRLKAKYIKTKDSFKASQTRGDVSAKQIDLLTATYRAATAAFNSTDKCISQSDLLGAYRSEFWAVDLAGTAINTLDHIPRGYDYLWENGDKLGLKRFKPSPTAFLAMQNVATIYFPDLARTLKKEFEKRGLPTVGFDNPVEVNSRFKIWERIMMITIVVVFMLIMLAIGIWVSNFNNVNIFIFRTVLALVGAAFGGIFIPGLIRVQSKLGKMAVTASGAAAFFVLIFLVNPPALVKNTVQTLEPKTSAPPTP